MCNRQLFDLNKKDFNPKNAFFRNKESKVYILFPKQNSKSYMMAENNSKFRHKIFSLFFSILKTKGTKYILININRKIMQNNMKFFNI